MPYRNGKFYRVGIDPQGRQKEYSATYFDIVRAINADPDLSGAQKAQAIKLLGKESVLDKRERAEILDKLYTKGYGTTVNNTTPLAKFIQDILLKRKN